jgi:signal transduction histidine kinase
MTVTDGQNAEFARICEITATAFGCRESRTLVWSREQSGWIAVARYPAREHRAPNGIDVAAIRLSSWFLTRLKRDRVVYEAPDATMRREGVLYMALMANDELVGVQVASGVAQRAYTGAEVAQHLAALASMALDNGRKAETLERSDHCKDNLLAAAAHELRDPLNVIAIQQALLKDGGALSERQTASVRAIGQATRRLTALIDNLLHVAGAQAAAVPLDVQEVAPGDIVEEVKADILADSPPHDQVELRYDVAENLPRVKTDPVKLRIVMRNLMANALKFTQQGSICLNIYARDDKLAVEVSDTGNGLDRRTRSIMFDPFKRGAVDASHPVPGSGLGLYVVRQFTDLLGGSIEVDSQAGRGTTFRVWLPLTSPGGGWHGNAA